jgi:hypothetical protein
MADHEHSPSGPAGCRECAEERRKALRGAPVADTPSEHRWNVWRHEDDESAFIGHAPTKAEAYGLAARLGGNEIQFGLDGEIFEVT